MPYQRTSTLFIRDLPQIYWLKIMTIYLAPKSVGGQYGLTLTVLFWYQLGSLVHLWPAGRWAGLRWPGLVQHGFLSSSRLSEACSQCSFSSPRE